MSFEVPCMSLNIAYRKTAFNSQSWLSLQDLDKTKQADSQEWLLLRQNFILL